MDIVVSGACAAWPGRGGACLVGAADFVGAADRAGAADLAGADAAFLLDITVDILGNLFLLKICDFMEFIPVG